MDVPLKFGTDMKITPVLILVTVLLVQGCEKKSNPTAVRQKELTRILKPLLKPAVYSFWEDEEESAPGWCEPTNREALRVLIAKYPETEEAYQAEVWLMFASQYTERNPISSEEKLRRMAMAGRLKIISQKTTLSGTAKMANIERAGILFLQDDEDHSEFEKQADEIIGHAKEYEREKSKPFLLYLETTETKPLDIEPTFRLLIVNEELCAHRQDNALALAKELKNKFPSWETQSVNGQIEMIELYKRGWTPENSMRAAVQIK
jgi:hypothetical protein